MSLYQKIGAAFDRRIETWKHSYQVQVDQQTSKESIKKALDVWTELTAAKDTMLASFSVLGMILGREEKDTELVLRKIIAYYHTQYVLKEALGETLEQETIYEVIQELRNIMSEITGKVGVQK